MKKVVVGMSGGVDSSVAACLLKNQGYEVIGITMNVWPNESNSNEKACCALSSVEDARRVCERLGIKHYVLNYRDDFKKLVIDNFYEEYVNGRTPNHCIRCNKYVKFGKLLEFAKSISADFIATGHYCKIEKINDKYYLKKANTVLKDQSYALYNLSQDILPYILFPCGNYEKEEIREIARKEGLVNANKHDSQEICFVENNDYAKFLEDNYNYKVKKGNFVLKDGSVVGKHNGIIRYTIGQRRGLGISSKEPLYVNKIDVNNNEVVVGSEKDLYKKEIIVDALSFVCDVLNVGQEKTVTVKVRYNAKEKEAVIKRINDMQIKVVFKESEKGIAPGQACVFYDRDVVYGGGIIKG